MAQIKKGNIIFLQDIKSENGKTITSDAHTVERFVDDFIIVRNVRTGDEISIVESMIKNVVEDDTSIGEKGSVKFNHEGNSIREITGADSVSGVFGMNLRQSVAVALLHTALEENEIASLVAEIYKKATGKNFTKLSEFIEDVVNNMEDDEVDSAMFSVVEFAMAKMEKEKAKEIPEGVSDIIKDIVSQMSE